MSTSSRNGASELAGESEIASSAGTEDTRRRSSVGDAETVTMAPVDEEKIAEFPSLPSGDLGNEADSGSFRKGSFGAVVSRTSENLRYEIEKVMGNFQSIFPASKSDVGFTSRAASSHRSYSESAFMRVYSDPEHSGETLMRRRDSRELERAMQSATRLQSLLHTKAAQFKVGEDCKVEIDTGNLPPDVQEEFARVLKEPLFGQRNKVIAQLGAEIGEASASGGGKQRIPKLTICILIVGTRGDVQPFIAIGRKLQKFGHRVRLASHKNYREFIINEGLEFFPLGGDPKLLAEYMVKNKGLLPSGPGEITMQRKQLKAIINSVWSACTEADVDSGGGPFVADAIIANPPTMGHITVAEALQVPLHVFFTMPWTPTEEFPSPLASVATSGVLENRLSYYVVDNLMWLGFKDMINDLRRKLRLKPIKMYHVPQYAIPYGYIWSPSLAPKPHDWGPLEDVVGFCFLDLASDYKPPQELEDFLARGEPPIFVGFGSLPVEDPKGLTETIIAALAETGQRGIIQKGWGGLGEVDNPPENVLILGNCPHDWLFPKCKAVIHHGGAGTTAAGLKAGCPTTIVPFFGDQFFWGQRVCKAGVGPEPVPVTQFSLEKLVKSINFMLHPEAQDSAKLLAEKITKEDGVEGAVHAFHRHLPAGFTARSKATPWLLQIRNIAKTSMCCCWAPQRH